MEGNGSCRVESKITGRSGVLGLGKEEGAEAVHLMWGTKTLLWEIRRSIMGSVVRTCLHCRENYCRQFSLYPDCHHSQPRFIPHSAWCTPASLRKLRMKSSDLCPLERKEHMTWPGPSDAQEPRANSQMWVTHKWFLFAPGWSVLFLESWLLTLQLDGISLSHHIYGIVSGIYIQTFQRCHCKEDTWKVHPARMIHPHPRFNSFQRNLSYRLHFWLEKKYSYSLYKK